MEWLKEEEFVVLKWPPYSSDLNPIKHIWVRLKEIIHKDDPTFKFCKGAPERLQLELAAALQEAWDKIELGFLESLVATSTTVPQRIQAVIEANVGWYTRYF